LHAPDGPSREKSSPDGISRLMPATAVNSPKRFTRSTSWTSPPAIARGAYLRPTPPSQPVAAKEKEGPPGRPGNQDRGARFFATRRWLQVKRTDSTVERSAFSSSQLMSGPLFTVAIYVCPFPENHSKPSRRPGLIDRSATRTG